jgi:3-phenylpropionate/trans-cinnamate dioxygenase ferredoxin subunit
MGFVKVAAAKDLAPGKVMGVDVGGKQIFIANVGGKYYALADRCTHMGCMLSDGKLKGEQIVCSCHGSAFDIKTGNAVKGPAKKPEPIFEAKVEGADVLVNV